MSISDYSVEGFEELWDYVDSFFTKTISNEQGTINQKVTGVTPEVHEE